MTMRIAGCDLGKASASFVTATVTPDGEVEIDSTAYVLHEGMPFSALARWYRAQNIAECAALGATGVYASELQTPALALPEDSCHEAALGTLPGAPVDLNLVSVGARGYRVLSRQHVQKHGSGNGSGTSPETLVQYLENEKCSSGTGENMQKIASRFGLTLPEADALAQSAAGSIPITARCSVFAKSEMTHYANQGKPASDLFAGYFGSVARNAAGLLARNRVDGPVYLVGGCAGVESFRAAFEKQLGTAVEVPQNSLFFEAVGAARLAAERAQAAPLPPLPASAEALIQNHGERLSVLEPARNWRHRVTVMPGADPIADWTARPAVLGLDLGSTGAKALLTCLETGEPLFDVYDRTRGNPVDAARRLVGAILEQGTPNVRAIGVTGSGREAAATLLKAVFPESDRVVVKNEIVAHATAAIRCDPDGGSDLSVIEIGGQDAKYIGISGGRIVDSDMNKACSAGTGSFLEEQGQFYDIHDINEFVAIAEKAERPPDLGQMCTVYVADAGAEAQKDGFELADIFAGFQYSIIHNYLDRVMGQRTLGQKIFFQGKPATNASLGWTLAAVTGRDIVVPPNPGAMGAWGIGLQTIEELSAAYLLAAPALELPEILRAEVTGRSEFACRDKRCQMMCPIERTTIEVSGAKRVAVSGGACPKFEVAGQSLPKLDQDAPNPFEQRAALMRAYERQIPGRPAIAIPLTGAIAGYLPWLATLVHELGYSVRILAPDTKSLAKGEQLCNSFDSCGPTKIAHAICDAETPIILFPKILDFAEPDGPGGTTCVTEQAMPEMAEQSLKTLGRQVRFLKPRLRFSRGHAGPQLTASLLPLVPQLGVTPMALATAVTRAAAAQRSFETALRDAGQQALAYARNQSLPTVVVCGPRHVIHDPCMNATIPTLLRQNGAMAIPMDCFPIPESTPPMKKVYWGDANRYLRAAAAARTMGDVFPLMLSSFGCGPASFTEQVFHAVLDGYPHTILESDGHGGTAGFVTRIQAFMESVRQFRAEDGAHRVPDNSRAMSYVERAAHRGAYLDRDVRYVFLSSVEYLGPLFAAVYRAYGYDAVCAPPLSRQNYLLGRPDCSGKECLSYQFVWGAFREYLEG